MRFTDSESAGPGPRPIPTARPRGAFTLIEVVLAISIAVGILTVVLLFYHQTTTLRTRLMEETSRLAVMRLVMERLNVELASARLSGPHGQGLSGGADNFQFVRLGFPTSWDATNPPPSAASQISLHLISYTLVQDTNQATQVDTNQTVDRGLLRSDVALGQAAGTNSVPPATNDFSAIPFTVSPSGADTNSLAGPTPMPPGGLISQIRFFHLRYWDGASWSDAWPGPDLPVGIEVSLGADPLPPELAVDAYPFEVFRRVIYLPNHGTNAPASLPGTAFTGVTR
jgi:type II secretory pathway pseudopilin PulG